MEITRFDRDEAHRLQPLGGRASFGMLRELTRSVGNDCAVEVDTNSYSVPWRQIGERVAVTVAAGKARVDLALTKFYLGLSSFGRLDVPMRAVVAAGAGAERST